MKNFDLLVSKLKEANAPVIYGLGGISMEEQRRAVRLARKLGAAVSVKRPLLPTVTLAALNNCDLILYAGGELPFEANGVKAIKDDRLLCVDAWRSLASLFRGNKLEGAEEYLPLYEKMKNAESAAVVFVADSVSETLRRTIGRFVGEAHKVGIMQISSVANALGAYEIMLEEAGNASAWFGESLCGGDEFAVENLPCESCDLLLRIGEGEDISVGVAPRFALAKNAYEGECHIEGCTAGGTALRFDGVPCEIEAEKGEYSILSLLASLTEEVGA